MAYLHDRYEVISLNDLSQAIEANTVPDGAVVLTFDDGYLDNFTTVSPILADRGLPATFFLTTDKLDRSEHHEFWWDALADGLLTPELDVPHVIRLTVGGGGRQFRTATHSDRLEAHAAIYDLVNEALVDVRDEIVETILSQTGRRVRTDPCCAA